MIKFPVAHPPGVHLHMVQRLATSPATVTPILIGSEGPARRGQAGGPDGRAGELGLGLDPDRKMIVLVAQESADDDDAEGDAEKLATARVWVRPAQMIALSVRALELVTAGRPLCPVCGLPMDPEGHLCPRKNGKSPVF